MNIAYTPKYQKELQKYAHVLKRESFENKMLCLVKNYKVKYHHSISSEEYVVILTDEIKTKLKQL